VQFESLVVVCAESVELCCVEAGNFNDTQIFSRKKNGKILANSEVLCIPLKPGVKSDVGRVGFWFVIIILLEFA
jgi:hypothetical protein